MKTHCYELPIRVLLSRDGRDHVAHGLELDLVGYGRTEKAAMGALHDMMEAQMSFASQTDQPELIYHPAPEELFQRWEAAHLAALRGAISPDRPAKMNTKAVFVTFNEQEIRSPKESSFHRVSESKLAQTA